MSAQPTPTDPPTASRARVLLLGLGLAALTIVVDQASKALALAHLSETERIPLVGDWFGLQLAFNTGASFSLGSDSTLLISIVGVLAVIGLSIALWRTRSLLWASGFGLVIGGAVGNLIDRLLADPGWGHGPVTDFLAYGNWFIGNIADVVIGVGVGIMVLAVIRRPDPRADAAADAAAPEDAGRGEA